MKQISGIIIIFVLVCLSGPAWASLSIIGTADYLGDTYNLIYDDDSSLVWFDYTNEPATYDEQVLWAASLTTDLTDIQMDEAYADYTIVWEEDVWRLPSVDNDFSEQGLNQTSSEMGNLFYSVLGNQGYKDENGDYNGKDVVGLINTDVFESLSDENWYWSQTQDGDNAWYFNFATGYQGLTPVNSTNQALAMAVRSATLVEISQVPLPPGFLLLGSGLLGGCLKKR